MAKCTESSLLATPTGNPSGTRASIARIVKHDSAEWEKHKGMIEQKYFLEGKPTKDVRAEMLSELQFDASIQQYERQFRKWDWRKYLSRDQYNSVDKDLKRKLLNPDHAQVSINGTVVPRKRLMKAIGRRNQPSLLSKWLPMLPSSMKFGKGDKSSGEVAVTPTTFSVVVQPSLKPGSKIDAVGSLPYLDLNDLLSQLLSPNASPRSENSAILLRTTSFQLLSNQLIQGNSRLEATLPDLVSGNLGSKDLVVTMAQEEVNTNNIAQLLFLLSNNHINGKDRTEIARLSMLPGSVSFIQSLASSSLPASIAFCQQLLLAAALNHHYDLLELLYRSGVATTTIIPAVGFGAITILQLAVFEGDLKMVTKMLEFGASPNWCASSTCERKQAACCCCDRLPVNLALHKPSTWSTGETLKLLFDAGAHVCEKCFDLTAAITGDIDTSILQHVLYVCPNINLGETRSKFYHTPLQAALYAQRLDMAQLLVAAGVPIDILRTGYEKHDDEMCICSPLTLTLINGNFDLAKSYFDAKTDINLCYLDVHNQLFDLHDLSDSHDAGVYTKYGEIQHGRNFTSQDNNTRSFMSYLREYLDIDDDMSFDVMEEVFGDLAQRMICYPLQAAILSSSLEWVILMLDGGADLCPVYGISPLHLAVLLQHVNIVRVLLEKAQTTGQLWQILHASTIGRTPLVQAMRTQNLEMMKLLIEAGADVCHHGANDITALEAAILHRVPPEHFRLILRYSFEDSGFRNWKLEPSHLYLRPLTTAAYEGQLEVMHTLLKFYLEFSYDSDLRTPAETIAQSGFIFDDHLHNHIARQCCNDRTLPNQVKFCIHKSKREDISAGKYHKGEVELIADIFRLGELLEPGLILEKLGGMLFVHAVRSADLLLAEWITRQGVKLCDVTWIAACKTSLKLSMQQSTKLINMLTATPYLSVGLKLEEDIIYHLISSLAWKRDTSRHELIRWLLSFLLEKGFDVNKENGHCLTLACAHESLTEIVDLLLQNGADPNLRFTIHPRNRSSIYESETALGSACKHGNVLIINQLITAGANVNVPANCADEPCLTIAAKHGHQDAVLKLIHEGAMVNLAASSENYARTPLQAACENGHLDIVIILINNNAPVNATAGSNYGVTALQAAAIKGYFKICQILIGCGAKVSAPASSYEGRTAIDGAAETGRLDIVKYLLDRYDGVESIADVCAGARKYARKQGHMGVVALLDSYPNENRSHTDA